jgi:hypothetical protein
MNTRTRIRLFAGVTLAVLAAVTVLGLNTNAGTQPAAQPSAPVVTAPQTVAVEAPAPVSATDQEFDDDDDEEAEYGEYGEDDD